MNAHDALTNEAQGMSVTSGATSGKWRHTGGTGGKRIRTGGPSGKRCTGGEHCTGCTSARYV